MAAELGSYKQAHTNSPPLTLGNSRVVEGPAPLKELGSRTQAMCGEIGSPRPPATTATQTTLHRPLMDLPAGGEPTGRRAHVRHFGLIPGLPAAPTPGLAPGIKSRELRFSRAMVFAIVEINNSTELLPGIKLGYLIHDSCASVPVAVHVAFQLSNGLDPVFYTGDNCSQSGAVMAVVDSDYGNNGMASFLKAAQKEGICVEYSVSFHRNHPLSRIQRVADVIRRSTAVVVVAFVAAGEMRILLEELSREPSPPRQWIGNAATDQRVCDGTEDIRTLQSPYTDTSQLRITNMVYKAVYAIAHAIHNVVCQKTNSTINCDKFTKIEGEQVLTQLKKVNFSRNGYDVSFDANGDPVARYELVNWQKNMRGNIELVTVGQYDASLPVGQEFRINKNLTWVEGGTQVPVSVCSDSCPPGTRKVLQKGKPICCYDCVACPEGEISNATEGDVAPNIISIPRLPSTKEPPTVTSGSQSASWLTPACDASVSSPANTRSSPAVWLIPASGSSFSISGLLLAPCWSSQQTPSLNLLVPHWPSLPTMFLSYASQYSSAAAATSSRAATVHSE
ncbi:hypothetical protein L3Q82_004940 [Scortum barcoo]|uniref:Uncharacterized protein n=1 Tax=Scortum barcoo TaxID=214431 RepID=A0ACB8VDG3_9TELE|nr:hypothetical protein L3Q82_004940 [Scortum barcoo]